MFIDVKYLYKLVFAPMEVKLNKMLDTNYVNVDKDFCLNFHTWRLYDTE